MVVCTFNVPQAAEHYEHNVDNNICVCHAVTYVSLMPQAAEHYEHKVDEEQRAFLDPLLGRLRPPSTMAGFDAALSELIDARARGVLLRRVGARARSASGRERASRGAAVFARGAGRGGDERGSEPAGGTRVSPWRRWSVDGYSEGVYVGAGASRGPV